MEEDSIVRTIDDIKVIMNEHEGAVSEFAVVNGNWYYLYGYTNNDGKYMVVICDYDNIPERDTDDDSDLDEIYSKYEHEYPEEEFFTTEVGKAMLEGRLVYKWT